MKRYSESDKKPITRFSVISGLQHCKTGFTALSRFGSLDIMYLALLIMNYFMGRLVN